jgi:hypothetical protein
VQALSSGRAAILGYTMPIFSAIYSVARPRRAPAAAPRRRHRRRGARRLAPALARVRDHRRQADRARSACCRRRVLGGRHAADARTTIAAPTLAIVFWMTLATTLVMTRAACCSSATAGRRRRGRRWRRRLQRRPDLRLAQPIWLMLARSLPPIASSMSVMLIPVLGTVIGRLVAEGAAALAGRRGDRARAAAIASVLWPARGAGVPKA